jgi:2-dehydropantoate 2-reductase
MKIGVVGCGALGSYYGARLARAGQEVHFLVRSDYDVVRHHGVRIRSVEGDFAVHPRCARSPEDIGLCDLVVIGLKTTANDQFPRLLPPLVGPRTRVVTLQNGLGNEPRLAALFGPDRIFGGLCFVCLNRVEPGVIDHTAHGLVVVGEYQRRPTARAHELVALLQAAGVPSRVTEDLERAHWEKLVWNVPFNGLGVAGAAGFEAVVRGDLGEAAEPGPCLATDVLLGDARWEGLARDLMEEVVAAGRALGYEIEAGVAEENLARTRCMGAYRASTLIDFARGQSIELEGLFLEPLRQARAVGVATPRLAAMCQVLRQLEAWNQRRRAPALRCPVPAPPTAGHSPRRPDHA